MKDLASKIMRYESGEMEFVECVAFFQDLIDTGVVWHLQGFYQRQAEQFIRYGHCVRR